MKIKKIYLLIFAIIAIFCFKLDVNATNDKYCTESDGYVCLLRYPYGAKPYYKKIGISGAAQDKFSMYADQYSETVYYCMDPSRNTYGTTHGEICEETDANGKCTSSYWNDARKYKITTTYSASSGVADADSRKKTAFFEAAAYIMSYGGGAAQTKSSLGSENTSSENSTGSGVKQYWSIEMAIRALAFTFGYAHSEDTSSNGNHSVQANVINTLIHWDVGSDISKLDNVINCTKTCTKLKTYGSSNKISGYNYFEGTPVDKAKSLFVGGLDYAYEYLTSATSTTTTSTDANKNISASFLTDVDNDGTIISAATTTTSSSGVAINSYVIKGGSDEDDNYAYVTETVNFTVTGLDNSYSNAYFKLGSISDIKITSGSVDGKTITKVTLNDSTICDSESDCANISNTDLAHNSNWNSDSYNHIAVDVTLSKKKQDVDCKSGNAVIKFTYKAYYNAHKSGTSTPDTSTPGDITPGKYDPCKVTVMGDAGGESYASSAQYFIALVSDSDGDGKEEPCDQDTTPDTNNDGTTTDGTTTDGSYTGKQAYSTGDAYASFDDSCTVCTDDTCSADTVAACKKSNSSTSAACKEIIDCCGTCDVYDTICNNTNDAATATYSDGSLVCTTDAKQDYEDSCEIQCDSTYNDVDACCVDDVLVIEGNDLTMKIEGLKNASTDDNIINACFVKPIDTQCSGTSGCTNINGTVDQNGNSFSLSALDSNKYCQVSCKEDYTYSMPTAKLVNSGRYFTFQVKVNGTKVCYTNTIADIGDLYDDIKGYENDIVQAYNDYNYLKAVDEAEDDDSITDEKFTTCTISFDKSNYTDSVECSSSTIGAYRNNQYTMEKAEEILNSYPAKVSELINEYKICEDSSSWTNSTIDYDDDSLYYTYDENDYIALLKAKYNSDNGTMSHSSTETPNNTSYICLVKDGKYADSSNCTNINSVARYKESLTLLDYKSTDEDLSTYTESDFYTDTYIMTESTIDYTYKPDTLFYNVYPYGDITTDSGADNVTALTNALPVSVSTKRGMYEYKINVSSLGEYYDSNDIDRLGRYIGGDDKSIVTSDTYVYTCNYLVNTNIDPDNTVIVCKNPPCFGPNCGNDCINCGGHEDDCENCLDDCIGVGCLQDGDTSELYERTISLNNMFPNGTKSVNWNTDKARDTIDDIQSDGEAIYDGTPILSVTITNSVASQIKNYNETQESNGGYNNDTLTCYSATDDYGTTYERIACYSDFITELISGTYGNVSASGDAADSSIRIASDNSKTGYFTLWDTSIAPISEDTYTGPSWK